jgi:hypothetical protein
MAGLPEGWVGFVVADGEVSRAGAKRRFPDGVLREVVAADDESLLRAIDETEAHLAVDRSGKPR